ncbi:MAG: tetratricopeptide repeat protein [Bradymonadia bacterium]
MSRTTTLCLFAIAILLMPISWQSVSELRTTYERSAQAAAYASTAEKAEGEKRYFLAIEAYQKALSLTGLNEGWTRRLTRLQCVVSAQDPKTLSPAAAQKLALRIKTAQLTPKDGPEIAVALAQIELIDGRVGTAHAAFEKAGTQYPKSALAQFVLGKSRLFRGNSSGAIDALSRAVKLEGNDFIYRALLGRTLHQHEKWARAEDELAAAAELKEDGMIRLLLGEARLKLHKINAAIDALQAAQGLLDKPRERARALAGLGFAQYQAGRFREAVSSLSESDRLSPTSLTRLNLARAYQGINDHRRAANIFEQVLESRPLDGANHVNWVRSLMALGQRIRAQQIYVALKKRSESRPTLSKSVAAMAVIVDMAATPAK